MAMTIENMQLRVRDLIRGFKEDIIKGSVVAWDGRLVVRPEYQREFIYDDAAQSKVLNTVRNGFPLNILYFVKRKETDTNGDEIVTTMNIDGEDVETYEVLDGQQRIISICRYCTNPSVSVKVYRPGLNAFDDVNFNNLTQEQKDVILDYELEVYVCDGTEDEKLDWFNVINIAGMKLYPQEIRNAMYHGRWLTDAKSKFSRPNCVAKRKYSKYLKGACERQDYLETVFRWHAEAEGIVGRLKTPEEKLPQVVAYMQKHRDDANADALWEYFENVFKWVEKTFGKYDRTMSGVEWGHLYNAHKDDDLDSVVIAGQLKSLLSDDEIARGCRKNIYEYILEGDEKVLNLRQFDEQTKRLKYNEQGGKCADCGKSFDFDKMHGDHIVPWSKGGKTISSNCQMLCRKCNVKKSNKDD